MNGLSDDNHNPLTSQYVNHFVAESFRDHFGSNSYCFTSLDPASTPLTHSSALSSQSVHPPSNTNPSSQPLSTPVPHSQQSSNHPQPNRRFRTSSNPTVPGISPFVEVAYGLCDENDLDGYIHSDDDYQPGQEGSDGDEREDGNELLIPLIQ